MASIEDANEDVPSSSSNHGARQPANNGERSPEDDLARIVDEIDIKYCGDAEDASVEMIDRAVSSRINAAESSRNLIREFAKLQDLNISKAELSHGQDGGTSMMERLHAVKEKLDVKELSVGRNALSENGSKTTLSESKVKEVVEILKALARSRKAKLPSDSSQHRTPTEKLTKQKQKGSTLSRVEHGPQSSLVTRQTIGDDAGSVGRHAEPKTDEKQFCWSSSASCKLPLKEKPVSCIMFKNCYIDTHENGAEIALVSTDEKESKSFRDRRMGKDREINSGFCSEISYYESKDTHRKKQRDDIVLENETEPLEICESVASTKEFVDRDLTDATSLIASTPEKAMMNRSKETDAYNVKEQKQTKPAVLQQEELLVPDVSVEHPHPPDPAQLVKPGAELEVSHRQSEIFFMNKSLTPQHVPKEGPAWKFLSQSTNPDKMKKRMLLRTPRIFKLMKRNTKKSNVDGAEKRESTLASKKCDFTETCPNASDIGKPPLQPRTYKYTEEELDRFVESLKEIEAYAKIAEEESIRDEEEPSQKRKIDHVTASLNTDIDELVALSESEDVAPSTSAETGASIACSHTTVPTENISNKNVQAQFSGKESALAIAISGVEGTAHRTGEKTSSQNAASLSSCEYLESPRDSLLSPRESMTLAYSNSCDSTVLHDDGLDEDIKSFGDLSSIVIRESASVAKELRMEIKEMMRSGNIREELRMEIKEMMRSGNIRDFVCLAALQD